MWHLCFGPRPSPHRRLWQRHGCAAAAPLEAAAAVGRSGGAAAKGGAVRQGDPMDVSGVDANVGKIWEYLKYIKIVIHTLQ